MLNKATHQQRYRERQNKKTGMDTLTDNSDEMLPAKIDLRRWLLSQIKGEIKVADLYAGEGVIWNALADKRITRLAADNDPAKGNKLRADAGAIAKAVSGYDIIDLDSHSSPYAAIAAIADSGKMPKGVAFTIGIVAPKRGSIENAIRSIIPADKMPDRDLARALFFCLPPDEFAEFAVRQIAQRIRAKRARFFYKMRGALVIYAAMTR